MPAGIPYYWQAKEIGVLVLDENATATASSATGGTWSGKLAFPCLALTGLVAEGWVCFNDAFGQRDAIFGREGQPEPLRGRRGW